MYKYILLILLIPNICAAQNRHFLDIRNRLNPQHRFDKYSNLMLRFHESCHFINGTMTVTHHVKFNKRREQVFYGLNNKEFYIPQPPLTMRRIATLIPNKIRSTRFAPYLVNYHKSWENEPLYIIEEWICYSNEVEACYEVESIYSKHINSSEYKDAIFSAAQFTLYAIPLLENAEPELIDFYKWNVERLDKYHTAESKNHIKLIHDNECKSLLKILVSKNGQEWVNKLFPKD